jgi:hypothetical protein
MSHVSFFSIIAEPLGRRQPVGDPSRPRRLLPVPRQAHGREQQSRNRMLCRDARLLRDAIHQFLIIILKLRILVLLPVSTLPCVVKVNNYS